MTEQKKTSGFFSVVEVARHAHVSMANTEIRSVIAHVIARERGDRSNDIEISIAFVSPREMRRLNRMYHREDRVTDVLAFPSHLSLRVARRATKQSRLPMRDDGLGELVICPSYVRQQAKRAGEPLRRELARVLIHGTLHLFGHDHARPRDAERMFALQESVVRRVTQR